MGRNQDKQVSPPLSEDALNDEFARKTQLSVSDSAVSDFEDSDQGTAMPPAPSFKSVLLQFLKTIATSGTDLYAMSSPAIMCSGISVLEYCAHYCDHPEILASIARGSTPLDRMLVVVQWYMSGLFGSYASRSTSSGFERKPFNPILGEQFFAEWPDEGFGTTHMFAEQVSHHPPTTAFYLHNAKAGVHVNAFSTQKTKFTGTAIKAEQKGNVFIYLDEHREEYMLSLPEIYVRGLLTGAPFIELCGDVAIVSSSGFGVKMRFIPKPWFSGEYDQVEALIFDTKSGKIHYDIWGKWSADIYFGEHDADDEEDSPRTCHFHTPSSQSSMTDSTGTEPLLSLVSDRAREGPILFSPELMPKTPFVVKPISEMNPLESRRVWHPVTKALKRADYDAANAAKNVIENEQRALRRERAENAETWTPKFFDFCDFCFLPVVHAEDEHLELILENLVTESPDLLVRNIESSKGRGGSHPSSPAAEPSDTGRPAARTHSHKRKLPYKGRWVYKDFLHSHHPAASN